MITDSNIYNTARSTNPHIFYGLAADPKPLSVPNGSMIVEMDTGKLYFYDAENALWLEWIRA